jgi:hypothetical protein
MKKAVYFEEANACDYLAQVMHLALNSEQAEYEVILRDGDKLINTDMGVMLERSGRQYTQKTYMTSFAGVAFVGHTSDPEKEVIKLKMLKVK